MPQSPTIPIETPVKIIGGPFDGSKGKILLKKLPANSDSGRIPSPQQDAYLILIDLDGDQVEAYLDRREFEVISN